MSAADVAHRYFELHNDGTPDDYGSPAFLSLYSEDCDIQVQLPADGAATSPTLADLYRSHEHGATRLRRKTATRYDLVADEFNALMRYIWQATTIDDSLGLPPGTEVRWNVAQFIKIGDGKIVRSHEYNSWMSPASQVPRVVTPSVGDATQTRGLIERWLELYNSTTSDSKEYAAMLSDDFEYHLAVGRGYGHTLPDDAFERRRWLPALQQDFVEHDLEPYEWIVDGPRAALRCRWYGTAARDLPGLKAGQRAGADLAAVLSIRDGRICRLDEHLGPELETDS